MRQLVINADDLGYDPAVTRGIVESMRTGIVSSTTFMVNTPYSEAAAREASGLAVGLHLNLARWRSIADSSHEFVESRVAQLDDTFVAKETRAQLDRLLALLERPATHIDVHKHLHRTPNVLSGVIAVARERNLPVRSPDDALRVKLRAAGVRTDDLMLGDAATDAYWTMPVLERELGALPTSGFIELMCHPGHAPTEVKSGYGSQREVELATFTSAAARALLKALEAQPRQLGRPMKRIFVSAEGRVRSGWVLAVFILIASAVSAPLDWLMRRLVPFAGRSGQLDDISLGASSIPVTLSALVATLVCWQLFKEPIGLVKPKTFWLGFFWGALALFVTTSVPVLVGHGTFGWPSWSLSAIAMSGLIQLMTIGPQSVAEELLFRGLPFQAFSRGTHPLAAIGLTSVFFGMVHLSNPNASWVAALTIMLVGVWLGLIAWRISLWASIGVHVAWNWFEGFVFGQPVSGLQPGASLIEATWPRQRSFWSGGDFGPEASGFITIVLLIGIVTVLIFSRNAADATRGN